jgi:hypothetical protein
LLFYLTQFARGLLLARFVEITALKRKGRV